MHVDIGEEDTVTLFRYIPCHFQADIDAFCGPLASDTIKLAVCCQGHVLAHQNNPYVLGSFATVHIAIITRMNKISSLI